MSNECPATALYCKLTDHFHRHLNKPDACRIKGGILAALKEKHEKHTCPMEWFKGRLADHTVRKLERDNKTQEDIRRGVVKNLAILFADIRGFTTTTADMAPERIVELLDLFVPEMLNIIVNRHSGMVDKLLGDGIMALYGHPYQTGREIVQALHSAVDMQQAAAALGNVLKIAGYEPVTIGVGINCGPVLVCEVGNDTYRENTVIGAPVNLAAKMEDAALAHEITLPARALETVEKVKPEILKFFGTRRAAHGVEVAVLDWRQYLENNPEDMEDWAVS
ncbi:MAG: adenylate/guanylate cyclase domain-containing protein [Pseudomonadota bacterium]